MRLFAIMAMLSVSALAVLGSDLALAQFFEGQSVLFGRTHVYQGQWCAYRDTGAGRVEEDCSFDSFEACRREALRDRGYCVQNPGYVGRPAPSVRSKKRRTRQ